MMSPGDGFGARANRAWQRITHTLDRHHGWFLSAFGVWYFTVTAIRSHATPVWHDEIYTLLLSRLPTIGDIWRAARGGADVAPPLNLFLTRVAESVAGSDPVVSRLPAMIGFWTMSVTVFYIVRARSTVVLASAAILVPWYTRAYRYSYEARGYGVMLGLFALLLLSWSEAARGSRRRLWLPIFALVWAASVWNHYFAILTFVPVACGELYRWARRGSPDWGLWSAATAGLICCAPLVSLARQASGQAATYWRHAAWTDVDGTYWLLFHDLWSLSPWLLAMLAVAVLIGLWRGLGTVPEAIAPGHEVIAGAVALAIPVLAVGLGQLSGAYTPRYAISGVAACALVVPLTIWWLGRRSGVVEVLLLLALGIGVVQASVDLFEHPPVFHDPVADRPLLTAAARESPPVVVAGAVQFLQVWYYAPPNLRPRLWYVADPARALRYLGADTADRGYQSLARWVPIEIRTYDQLAIQRSFTLYDDRSGWLTSQLRDAGAMMSGTTTELGARVLQIRLPDRR
jgi:hypothetical protein